MSLSQAERITRLEVEVSEVKAELQEVSKKLDDLLVLRYKGAGAFWLATTLIGTGIIGALTHFFHFFGGR